MKNSFVRSYVVIAISVLIAACSSVATQDNFRARWSQLDVPDLQTADVEAEVLFGREVAARFLGENNGVDNASLQVYVNTLGQYLVQFCGRSDLEFHFWVIESDLVNAYAMPGGYVFVTSAAIDLMHNEAELAGVLSHEIAHVTQRHIVNALDIRGSARGRTLTQISAGASDVYRVAFEQVTEQALSLLREDGLQQVDEFEADEVGTLIMVQAGYQPTAYSRYLNRVNHADAAPLQELSKTHPSINLRLQRLRIVQQENALQNLGYPVMEHRFLAAVSE
ncbi:MAG: M48 family metalloprotease [Reinekea sp.]